MLSIFLATLLLVGLAVAGIGVRTIFIKDGEFRGTCSSNNPMLTNQIGECTICGAKSGEECQNDLPEVGSV